MNKKQILDLCKYFRICCEISANRFTFYTAGSKPHTFGRVLGYCIGRNEASRFLEGYREGKMSR